jgi:tetratricopeptide (TPR) repeat protein
MWLDRKRTDSELKQIRAQMESGRFATARKGLAELASGWFPDPEVLYRLGECERALGHFDLAQVAWSRVPAGSQYASLASAASADDLINRGEYSRAEVLLLSVRPRSDAEQYAIERALIRLYRFLGRDEEVKRLLRASLVRSPDPAADLKELWLTEFTPVPVEALEFSLKKANSEDDRVWLGLANVSTLTGRYEEAGKWLESCRAKRPNDPAVARAALDLATAQGDPRAILTAAESLSEHDVSPEAIAEIRARLASQLDAPGRELESWLAVLDQNPGHAFALERLAALSAARGEPAKAQEYRERKTKIDLAKDRFRRILLDNDLYEKARELAELARQLGLEFESRGWSILAEFRREGWATHAASLTVRQESEESSARSLASLLADFIPYFGPVAPGTKNTRDVLTPPRFRDLAQSSGLHFTFDHGVSNRRLLPETMSGGVAVLDFDRDGWLDVYVVQGGHLDDEPGKSRESDRLFRNLQNGSFEDVTDRSGIAALPRGYGLGVTVGDFDNDGNSDLFVTRLRSYALIRNRGDGTFEDATEAAGLRGVRDNPTSAAFGDLDADGDLDLYVCHYMIYDPAHPVQCKNERGEFFYCDPSRVQPAPDRLFRNDSGRFVEITSEAGIVDKQGRGLGVVAADLDEDGRTDLFVANDGTANFLFRNLGGLKFEEVALSEGVAAGGDGGYQACMGVACGDLDRDGRLDLVVTNFYGEGSTLYHNLGGGQFTDWTNPSGLGRDTRYLLGFGTAFLDYDNNGILDLVTANGHVNDNRPYYPYAMPSQLSAGTEDGRLVDVSKRAGAPWNVPRVGRGLAVADLDNDGRQDVLILSQGEPLAYLKNETEGGRNVSILLEGTTSNREGTNARVALTVDGKRQFAERFGGGSYQSSSDPRLHFGVGNAESIDLLEVHWPSGKSDRFEKIPIVSTGFAIREGEGIRPLRPQPNDEADSPRN